METAVFYRFYLNKLWGLVDGAAELDYTNGAVKSVW